MFSWGKKGLINKVKGLGLSHKSLARCMECSTRCPNVSIVKINVFWDVEDTHLNHSPQAHSESGALQAPNH